MMGRTTRFFSQADVEAKAIEVFTAAAAPGPAVLMLRDAYTYAAAKVLASVGIKPKVVRRLNQLAERYEREWLKHSINKGGYFDLKPAARIRAEAASDEYFSILERPTP